MCKFKHPSFQLQYCEANCSNYENVLQRKIQTTDCDRAQRLHIAARSGDIVRTKEGVFQNSPCNDCGSHHKVSRSLRKQAPCPGTEAGKKYFSTHKGEKLRMETASLKKLLQNRNDRVSERLLDNLPKLATVSSRSAEGGKDKSTPVVRSKSTMERPKTARGRPAPPPPVPTGRTRSASVDQAVSNKSIAEKAKKDTFGFSWKDIFSESQLSSESSDFEGSEKSAGTMKRSLVREMFTQEEEALRLVLAKQKECHNQNMRRAALKKLCMVYIQTKKYMSVL